MDLYVEKVCPAYPGTPAAARNVAYWLARGHTEEEMRRAIDNYAADMRKLLKSARYRRAPANFFCRAEPTFLGYTEPRAAPAAAARPKRPPEPQRTPQERAEESRKIHELLAASGLLGRRAAAVG